MGSKSAPNCRSIQSAGPILSVILPAYNEAERIDRAIEDIREGIPLSVGSSWELIVVDDGSSDDTQAAAARYEKLVPRLQVFSHDRNLGKGAAVRTGVLASRGQFVLFADADGATPFVESHALLEAVQDGADIAIGKRSAVRAKRTLPRRVMAAVFRTAVRMIVNVRVSDPQCGFKLFAGHHARSLFRQAKETGYLFDLEVLGMATRQGLTISESEVRWQEIPGSHIRIVRDSIRMFTGLYRVRTSIRSVARRRLIDEANVPEVSPGVPLAIASDSVTHGNHSLN